MKCRHIIDSQSDLAPTLAPFVLSRMQGGPRIACVFAMKTLPERRIDGCWALMFLWVIFDEVRKARAGIYEDPCISQRAR
jgi:hypothetical protein